MIQWKKHTRGVRGTVIETLRLKHFRNYPELTLSPHPGLNLLFGPNGAGKTNILEAIHYCALGKSHRAGSDREVVEREEDAGACAVTVRGAAGRSEIMVRLTPGEPRKKTVWIDRKKAERLADLMGHVRCVIFSPEDLSLVREGPSQRRRYLDMMICQLDPMYFMALQRYARAMEERGALLREARKQEAASLPDALLAPYEAIMAAESRSIIARRRQAMARLAPLAAEKYGAIAGDGGEQFRVDYSPNVSEGEDLARTLREHRWVDMNRGAATHGPHREDLALSLNGREMKLYASQGQVRTAALALKLAQLLLFREETGEMPVLLLDDVMSELDMRRRTRLLGEIGDAQTFVTCTDESDLEGFRDCRTCHVTLTEDRRARLEETRPGPPVPDAPTAEEPDFS